MNFLIGKALKPASLLSLLALCPGLSSASVAGFIDQVSVGKEIGHIQTSATDVQLNPYEPPYEFSAWVGGVNIDSITPPVVTGPVSVPQPFALFYDNTYTQWRYFGNGGDEGWESSTLDDLNAHFGSGVYTINVNGTSIPLNLTGDAYPNVPIFTLSGGEWSGGKYVIDVSHDLTLTTNAFTAYGTHLDDSIHIEVEDTPYFAEQSHSLNPGTNFLSMTVPAFSLVSGQDYFSYIEFFSDVDINPNASLPFSINSAGYGTSTGFTISAVPVPAATWLFGSGLLGLIGLARKRKAA